MMDDLECYGIDMIEWRVLIFIEPDLEAMMHVYVSLCCEVGETVTQICKKFTINYMSSSMVQEQTSRLQWIISHVWYYLENVQRMDTGSW